MVFEAIKTQIAGRVAFGEKVRYYFSPGGKKIHRSCCEEGDVRGIACFMVSAGWGGGGRRASGSSLSLERGGTIIYVCSHFVQAIPR